MSSYLCRGDSGAHELMFELAFKNIDDALRKEAGCATELDYAEQTSWLLFLKYLDGLEQDPSSLSNSSFKETNQEAAELGLDECAG